jgi:DNA polymerase-3 subunit beta
VRFRCERDALKDALQIASRAVKSQGQPALTGVRLALTGDRLQIRGSDVELTIETGVEVAGDADGAVLLKAKLLTDIVTAMEPGAITIEVTDDVAVIEGGRSHFELHLLPLDAFPQVNVATGLEVQLDASTLETSLREVLRAAATDENRPILTGVLFTAVDDGLRLVTTDSYRLALSDVEGAASLGGDQGIVVPKRALDEVVRLLADTDKLQVTLGERDATFIIGATEITTRLIEGSFPNYEMLLPSGYPNRVTVDRLALIDALKRAKLLVKNASTAVKVKMSPDGLELSVDGFEEGSATEVIDATYEGTELVIGFNPDYLSSGLEAVDGDEAVIETVDAAKVARIGAPGDDSFLYLLMPHRIG